MRRMIDRTICADTWIGQVGLGIIASASALFFALSPGTFASSVVAYRVMAAVGNEQVWAEVFGALALLTWLALWLRGDGHRADLLWRVTFAFLHGPIWCFVGWSVLYSRPSAYFPWWSLGAFLLAEWVALQPTAALRYRRWRAERGN